MGGLIKRCNRVGSINAVVEYSKLVTFREGKIRMIF